MGITGQRSSPDEKLISAIRSNNPTEKDLILLDARPIVNAIGNKAALGAGFESSSHYGKALKIKFLGIENIHVMRASQEKIYQACTKEESSWYGALEVWMNHIQTILVSAKKTAKLLQEGYSVVIHCSDGFV